MSFALSLIAAWATSGAFPWQLYGSVWVWLSGLSEGIYFLSLGVVYQRLSLGLGYLMMRGLSMLGVTVCSVLLLGEELSAVKIAGMAAIGLGVILRGISDTGRGGPPDKVGMAAALACAFGIGGYHIGYGRALAQGLEPLTLFAASLSLALLSNLLVLGPRWAKNAFGACRGHLGGLTLAACICMAAFWLFLRCLGAIDAGAAICLRNLSVVFAQGLAWAAGEQRSAKAGLAVAFFVLGGGLLVLAP
jgi:drug/metabolite transporter (DMT)-like permease